MVINMNESKLCTIEQIEQFLLASADVAFTAFGGDLERYAHISRVLNRFDYFHCSRKDRGVLLRYGARDAVPKGQLEFSVGSCLVKPLHHFAPRWRQFSTIRDGSCSTWCCASLRALLRKTQAHCLGAARGRFRRIHVAARV
jgi:hypothetical protein